MDKQVVRSSTSDAEFFFALLRVATAQIFRAAGIDKCAPAVLDTATDLLRRHLLLLAERCQERAELSGRRRVELADLADSMQSMGLIHPFTTIDNSDGWEMVEKEEELKELEAEKVRIEEEIRHLKERESELKKEHGREVLKVKDKIAKNKAADKASAIDPSIHDKIRKQITGINGVKAKINSLNHDLKILNKKYDYTTFGLEQVERDPSVAGFLKFVDWAKGEAASLARFVSRPPLTAAQQAAQTKDSKTPQLGRSQTPDIKAEDKSKSKALIPSDKNDTLQQYSEEWLYTLMKKQSKAAHENRFMHTALAPAPVGGLTIGSGESYGFIAGLPTPPSAETNDGAAASKNTRIGSAQLSSPGKRRVSIDLTGSKREFPYEEIRLPHSKRNAIIGEKHSRIHSEPPHVLDDNITGSKAKDDEEDDDDDDDKVRIFIQGGPPTLEAQVTASNLKSQLMP